MRPFAPLLLAIFLSTPLAALETDWMQLQKNAQDPASGVRIMAVENGGDNTLVTVAIPKQDNEKYRNIEEVVVIGKRPDQRELPLPDISYEWADDFEGGYYGLLIRIGNIKTPVRFFFHAESGVQPELRP